MIQRWYAVVLVLGTSQLCTAQETNEADLRSHIAKYVATFNEGDAAELAGYWATDGVSVAAETGVRTEGRDALQAEFAQFFSENPNARLTGAVDSLRMVRPEVAVVEGRTTLFLDESTPVESAFTAILVKEGDNWLISSSHERDLPQPSSSYDALKELEWLIGTWQDQSDDVQVTTTVRWAPSQAFLIRSFSAQLDADPAFEGTQIIGWDPLNQQIRTWTFNSDGSFGQGTMTKHDDDWMHKMWHVLADGRLATGTKVMTRVDDNTLSVRAIGETVDGEAMPSSPAVTVVRAGGSAAQTDEGGTP